MKPGIKTFPVLQNYQLNKLLEKNCGKLELKDTQNDEELQKRVYVDTILFLNSADDIILEIIECVFSLLTEGIKIEILELIEKMYEEMPSVNH